MTHKWFNDDAKDGKKYYNKLKDSDVGFHEISEFNRHLLICHLIKKIENLENMKSKSGENIEFLKLEEDISKIAENMNHLGVLYDMKVELEVLDCLDNSINKLIEEIRTLRKDLYSVLDKK